MDKRKERVAQAIREKIGEFIIREINSNDLLSVTRVELTGDLREARVYISSLINEKECLEGLKKAKPSVRAYLAKEINLRYTPDLSFFIEEDE
ncbi:MAG: 30S ribosome-binding factor RbfA [bacterium]